MYFPFHTENAPDLPTPGSWYEEFQNRPSRNNTENDAHNDTSLQIAVTIVNELAELSAWIQRQSSAFEASNHIMFDAEGRPVFDVSMPIVRGPVTPVVPPSYSRATAENANLPSLDVNSTQPADYQRFLSRYSANVTSSPIQYSTPPPSYSRATSQQLLNSYSTVTNSLQLLTPRIEPGPVIGRTPPPSYRRAIGEHRERPCINALMEISEMNPQNNNCVSNITVG